jgi:hypothetical protein
MKTLEEKKLLVKMAKILGQPVDPALIESIEKEEKLNKTLFKEEELKIAGYEKGTTFLNRKPIFEVESKTLLSEVTPTTVPPAKIESDKPKYEPAPAQLDLIPKKKDLVQQTMSTLNVTAPKLISTLERKELEGMKRTIAEMMHKIGTLSWGGGGTGVVRFIDLDDHKYPKDIDYLQFNESQTDTSIGEFAVPGTLWWNTQEDCLNIKQSDDTTLQVGLEQYIRVRNLTGNTMNSGTLVQFAGVNGSFDPIAAPLLADSDFNPIFTIGVLTENIANNDVGRATTFGKVRRINTTGSRQGQTWNLGDLLWACPLNPGCMTNVKPTAPNTAISIAAVTRVDATQGEILVRPTITPRLYYGDFVRTTSQTANTADTAFVVELNETEFASGFTLGANSEIIAVESGLYKVAITLNFTSSTSSLTRFYHWIRVNGVDVPNSTIRGSIAQNGGDAGVASNHIVSLNAGDNVQIMWAVGRTQVSLVGSSATAFAPTSPAAIVNIFQVNL